MTDDNQSGGYAAKMPIHYFQERPIEAGAAFGPAFVGVGAAKSGTTRWYKLITSHPQAIENVLGLKEINYFSYFGFETPDASDNERYRSYFARPPGAVSGEWSPGYFFQPFAMEHLARAAPDTKIILILRDPIARMLSQMSQLARVRMKMFGLEGDAQQFFHMTTVIPESFTASLYAAPLKRLFATFNRSNILVLQFEKTIINPRENLRATYRFLGLSDDYIPEQLNQIVNGSPIRPRPLDPTARARLAERFSADLREAADLLSDIDFDLWPDIAPFH